MTIANAKLIIGVNHIDSLLNGVRQFRNTCNPFRPKHALGNLFQIFRRHHTITPRILRNDHMAQQRFKHAQILFDLLVSHHGDHADELLEIVILLNRGTQRFCRIHIMPAIQNDRWRCTNLLDAAWNPHRAQRLSHKITVKRTVDGNHHFRRTQGRERIMGLMFAEFGDRHFRVRAIRRTQGRNLTADCRNAGHNFRFDAIPHQIGMVLPRRFLDNRHDSLFMRLTPDDRGAARLDNADFFGCDLFHGIAKPCHMVHVDRSDNGRIGIEHVGGVPAAAHTDFNDGHIDRSVGELPDGHGGEHFEEAHFWLVEFFHLHVDHGYKVFDLIPGINEIVVGKLLPVDGDALVDMFKMR